MPMKGVDMLDSERKRRDIEVNKDYGSIRVFIIHLNVYPQVHLIMVESYLFYSYE